MCKSFIFLASFQGRAASRLPVPRKGNFPSIIHSQANRAPVCAYRGITYCSTPENLYWFNPVEVLLNELLAGATIALPSEVITILTVLRIASQIMFGFFLSGTVLCFVLIFLSPLAVLSRWWSLPLALVAGLTSALVTSASIVGSVISFVFKYAAEAQSDLNIHAQVGTKMFVFIWVASGFALISFIAHAGMGCCCTSVRDVKTGRKPIKPAREPPVAAEEGS